MKNFCLLYACTIIRREKVLKALRLSRSQSHSHNSNKSQMSCLVKMQYWYMGESFRFHFLYVIGLEHQNLINPISKFAYSRVHAGLIWFGTKMKRKSKVNVADRNWPIKLAHHPIPQLIIPANWKRLSVRWITMGL